MILRPAINFITPTGGNGVTSCFCMEPFNKHLKVTTCNDRDKATINQGAVSLQLTCISGNRARVSWRNRTPFSYLYTKIEVLQLIWFLPFIGVGTRGALGTCAPPSFINCYINCSLYSICSFKLCPQSKSLSYATALVRPLLVR